MPTNFDSLNEMVWKAISRNMCGKQKRQKLQEKKKPTIYDRYDSPGDMRWKLSEEIERCPSLTIRYIQIGPEFE